jgi:hypothetical protein
MSTIQPYGKIVDIGILGRRYYFQNIKKIAAEKKLKQINKELIELHNKKN